MTIAQQTGTLADVRDARRALMAAVQPWWVQAMQLAGPAFMAASTLSTPLLVAAFGGTSVVVIFGAGIVMLAVIIAAGVRLRATRRLRPFKLHLWSRRAGAAVGALFVAWLIVTLILMALVFRWELPAWCFSVLVLVLIVVLMVSCYALAWRVDPYGIDSRLLREVPDHPTFWDRVLGSRQPLAVCAVLASVGQMDAGLLARVLRLTDPELGQHTTELVRAQYLYAYPEGARWWFGLTPLGRTVYRRHLRALLQAGGGTA
ncbi:hypothetical protein [Mycobacterium talmoniae]|uniref:Uncharacterized protein n=1 Tax=Mycobacterium talmoniae TaxID=1858794 RepID=A0A1S1NAZ7_9MYCO|nr:MULTISPECIES: hypothetical protein [Mycobacterium]OHU95458.1 hypothetical protein BKN37_23160 [Mycobacterium talmoniae]PQM48895.1 hypothetical protein C1Y40_00894 [Mycobacterium talmoniae]TDH49184.1 hypothetical protein E2F47_21305 [Mycobacterium eburneum]